MEIHIVRYGSASDIENAFSNRLDDVPAFTEHFQCWTSTNFIQLLCTRAEYSPDTSEIQLLVENLDTTLYSQTQPSILSMKHSNIFKKDHSQTNLSLRDEEKIAFQQKTFLDFVYTHQQRIRETKKSPNQSDKEKLQTNIRRIIQNIQPQHLSQNQWRRLIEHAIHLNITEHALFTLLDVPFLQNLTEDNVSVLQKKIDTLSFETYLDCLFWLLIWLFPMDQEKTWTWMTEKMNHCSVFVAHTKSAWLWNNLNLPVSQIQELLQTYKNKHTCDALITYLHEHGVQDFDVWLKHKNTRAHAITRLTEVKTKEELEEHIAGFEDQISPDWIYAIVQSTHGLSLLKRSIASWSQESQINVWHSIIHDERHTREIQIAAIKEMVEHE